MPQILPVVLLLVIGTTSTLQQYFSTLYYCRIDIKQLVVQMLCLMDDKNQKTHQIQLPVGASECVWFCVSLVW